MITRRFSFCHLGDCGVEDQIQIFGSSGCGVFNFTLTCLVYDRRRLTEQDYRGAWAYVVAHSMVEWALII